MISHSMAIECQMWVLEMVMRFIRDELQFFRRPARHIRIKGAGRIDMRGRIDILRDILREILRKVTLWRHGTAIATVRWVRASWSVWIGGIGSGLRELVAVTVARVRTGAGWSTTVRASGGCAIGLPVTTPLGRWSAWIDR